MFPWKTPLNVSECFKAVSIFQKENGAPGGKDGKTRYEWDNYFLVTIVSRLQIVLVISNSACGLLP